MGRGCPRPDGPGGRFARAVRATGVATALGVSRSLARAFATGGHWTGLAQDLRLALRLVARSPLFALAVVATSGSGSAPTRRCSRCWDQVLLRPLAVRWPDELVVRRQPGAGHRLVRGVSDFSTTLLVRRSYRDLRDGDTATSSRSWRASAGARTSPPGGEPERIETEIVSGNYFEVLGVGAARGSGPLAGGRRRPPGPAGRRALPRLLDAPRSEAIPTVVGRVLRLNGHPFTVARRGRPGLPRRRGRVVARRLRADGDEDLDHAHVGRHGQPPLDVAERRWGGSPRA